MCIRDSSKGVDAMIAIIIPIKWVIVLPGSLIVTLIIKCLLTLAER